jgi:hypothetical protein
LGHVEVALHAYELGELGGANELVVERAVDPGFRFAQAAGAAQIAGGGRDAVPGARV